MAKKKKKGRYDDKFRASAIIMLEAAGYPDKKGSLQQVSRNLGVAHSTLSRWANNVCNPPPSNIVHEKRAELKDLLRSELDNIFKEMPEAITDASYRDLGVVAGILFDKLQLISGRPTEIVDDSSGLTDDIRIEKLAAIFNKARARASRPDTE